MTLRVLLAVAGSLITLAGVVFALQGVGVIGGSFMSGTTICHFPESSCASTNGGTGVIPACHAAYIELALK